jgi:2'-5' RNA ligase
MDALYVVAFPVLPPATSQWLERLRAEHDPAGHALLPAHFTLVFGCRGPGEREFVAHVRTVAAGHRPFAIEGGRAERFVEGDLHYVFLVPRHGDAALRELHRDLHTGLLQPFARADRPFQPHITIARTTDARRARELCARVDEEMPRLGGSIDALTVGALAAGAFAPLARIGLI